MSNPSTAEPPDLPITPVVLQRWQEELQLFFTATRNRLQELQPAPQAAHTALHGGNLLRSPHPDSGRSDPAPPSPASASHDPVLREPVLHEPILPAPLAHDAVLLSSAISSADGPPDRLQELKRRLAAQLARE